ncbi:O-antigen ligase family protein [Planococcus beigongshangi]|uniref:O-antigen ligase family protein n=1 Tax=Planococcus beigongshangi TaxID=2782536 RepID=UPI00193C1996|nr:O-antigen ligase family protein [Planococcus beigongshangi]
MAILSDGSLDSARFRGNRKDRKLGSESSFLTSKLFIFYMLWPIIITPKEVQFVVFTIIALVLLAKHEIFFDSISYFLFSYILVYALSISYNLIQNSYEMTRILATVNSFGIWIIAFILFLVYKEIDLRKTDLIKIIFVNYCILLAVWAVSAILSSLTGLTRIRFMGSELYYSETFNGDVVVRFVSFMEYPNLVIMFCIFFYPFFYLQLRKFSSKIFQVTLMVAGVLPVVSTYSRSGYLVFFLIVALATVYLIYRFSSREIFLFLACAILAVAVLVFTYTNLTEVVILKLEELATARAGSNDSRQILIAESFSQAWDNSRWIGMGIKDASSIGYPLGSHSTLLGFFYKTGIVGFLLGCMLLIQINFKLLLLTGDLSRMLLRIAIIMMPFLFIVEDMDGSNWLIVIYFIFVGLLLNDKIWETDGLR